VPIKIQGGNYSSKKQSDNQLAHILLHTPSYAENQEEEPSIAQDQMKL